MDSREAEEQLSELESRIERLRGLYEQYFMGIEKTEPQIPRKEVERRIWLLRREQIRNTGLRFKFQMLVQRYNSFQQYWGRVAREIENGTYRRDVMRAAARFGEKEALTILGKKRRDKYLRLAEVQKDQRNERASTRPSNGEHDGRSGRAPSGQHVEELDASQLESVPPTPPPPMPEPARAAARPAAPDPDAARRRVAALAAQMKASAPRPVMPDTSGPLDLDLDLDTRRPPARRSTTPRGVEPLRRKSSTRMPAVKIPPAPAVPSDLRASAEAKVPPRKPSRPPARRRSSSMKAVQPPTVPPRVQPAAPAPAPASPARAPAPSPAAARAPAASPAAARAPSDELQEHRLRQIYAKYIESRRNSNESVAGVTFEKLAESLRSQAAKLRAVHPTRRVDYEVVVKDGKTVLKPILR